MSWEAALAMQGQAGSMGALLNQHAAPHGPAALNGLTAALGTLQDECNTGVQLVLAAVHGAGEMAPPGSLDGSSSTVLDDLSRVRVR